MSFIEETNIEVNFTLNKQPFTAENTTIKTELVDFDNRDTANEVDCDVDQKSAIKALGHIKREGEYLETHSEDNFSLKEDHFTAENVTVKKELDDFDNRTAANEVDEDLEQKATIKSEEEENFVDSPYLINAEEVDIKSEDDEEQSDNGLENHKVRHKPEDQIRIHKCPDCPYESKRKDHVKEHALVHNKTGQLQICKCKCVHCGYETLWKQSLKRHIMVRHGENIPWIYCPELECSYKTYETTKLKRHSRVHSNEQFFKCTQCPYQTKHQFHLKTHQLKHESTDKWHACSQCPYKTFRKFSLSKHVQTHSNQLEWYECEQCPFKTTKKYNLKRHLSMHNRERAKLLQCTCCSFKTLHKSNFRRHQIKHQGHDFPRRHNCPDCPYKSKYKGLLLVHAKHHSAADKTDWLQCPECSYRTRGSSHLRAHQMLHTATAEWFRCFDCPFKTNWKPSLVAHVKTHKTRQIDMNIIHSQRDKTNGKSQRKTAVFTVVLVNSRNRISSSITVWSFLVSWQIACTHC